MCEWLAERIGVKAWMSLTGITRKALGGDDEATRDAFVAAEAKSQLDAAREAVAQK